MKKQVIKLTEKDLHDIIEEAIVSVIKQSDSQKLGRVISEGVHYDELSDLFVFDFENDYKTDIIKLKKVGYEVSAFNHCYYYGYQFENAVDSEKRTNFIHSIKFPDGRISDRDKNTFILTYSHG